VTHLRKIMLEELKRRNYARTTIDSYIHTVEHFAQYFRRSPDQLGPDHIREYQVALFKKFKLAPNTVSQRLAALGSSTSKLSRRAGAWLRPHIPSITTTALSRTNEGADTSRHDGPACKRKRSIPIPYGKPVGRTGTGPRKRETPDTEALSEPASLGDVIRTGGQPFLQRSHGWTFPFGTPVTNRCAVSSFASKP
jgi:Phage integrase, N-terminal SAM-like domain